MQLSLSPVTGLNTAGIQSHVRRQSKALCPPPALMETQDGTLFKVLSTVLVQWALSDKCSVLGSFHNYAEMTFSKESTKETKEIMKRGGEPETRQKICQ